MAAKFPCDIVLPECGCSENPVRNFSSADPDLPTFTGIKYVALIPPLGTAWSARNCVGVYESTISQADADQQAQNAAITCAVADWRGPTFGSAPSPPVPPPVPTRGNTPYQVVPNQPQTQTVYCPDGSPFSYTTPAGTFVGVNLNFNTALLIANAKAKSYALEQAQLRQVCLGGLLTLTCLNEFYSSSITATGKNVSGGNPQSFGNATDDWEIISGMVPPGLVFHGGPVFGGTVIINGTPTMAGTFMFTVQITDTAGDKQQKDYQITVAGITNLPAPPAQVDVPYSYQLATVGWNNTGTFSVISGGFPAGLTLSAAGLISGTATTAGSSSAVVQVTDPVTGFSCAQAVAITSAVGQFKFNINWSNPGQVINPPATGSASYRKDGGDIQTSVVGGGSAELTNDSFATPQIMACTATPANLHVVISNPMVSCVIRVIQNGVELVHFNPLPPGGFSGTFDVPFTIGAQAHGIPVVVTVDATNGGGINLATNVTFTLTPS